MVCIVCGNDKDLSAFYVRKESATGHRNSCKECDKKRSLATWHSKD